ncbi:MAG: hypothetical protein EHM70_25490, partial [Chloroflexota bacterium]
MTSKRALHLMWVAWVMAACTFVQPTSTPPPFTPTPSITASASPAPSPTPTPTLTPTPLPVVRIEAGDMALEVGDYDQAAREYEAARTGASDPEMDTAASLGLGKVYLGTGN